MKKHYVIIEYVPVIKDLAVVAELAYALDSGSSPRKWVGVQVPSTALLMDQGFRKFTYSPGPLIFCV